MASDVAAGLEQASQDSLRPTKMTSQQMEAKRQAALRKFRTGWVVDADDDPTAALALDATRQVRAAEKRQWHCRYGACV